MPLTGVNAFTCLTSWPIARFCWSTLRSSCSLLRSNTSFLRSTSPLLAGSRLSASLFLRSQLLKRLENNPANKRRNDRVCRVLFCIMHINIHLPLLMKWWSDICDKTVKGVHQGHRTSRCSCHGFKGNWYHLYGSVLSHHLHYGLLVTLQPLAIDYTDMCWTSKVFLCMVGSTHLADSAKCPARPDWHHHTVS